MTSAVADGRTHILRRGPNNMVAMGLNWVTRANSLCSARAGAAPLQVSWRNEPEHIRGIKFDRSGGKPLGINWKKWGNDNTRSGLLEINGFNEEAVRKVCVQPTVQRSAVSKHLAGGP